MARKAVELARAAALVGAHSTGAGERARHIGFYLIDKGLPELERAAEVRLSSSQSLQRAVERCPLLIYLGTIVLLSVILSAGLLAQALALGMPLGALLPIALLSLLSLIHI